MLKIAFHGGKCCGIKIIHGFDGSADHIENAINKSPFRDPDSYGHNVSSSQNFFTDEAPEETTKERLDRYIEFLKRKRPQGIIEVVLAQSSDSWGSRQMTIWGPLLRRRGFRKVSECHNSNSGNRIYVLHKCLDK